MKIEEIKKKMIAYRDFYGFDLLGVDEVNKATTKKELATILNQHETHIEMMCNDAQASLGRFRNSLGLNDVG